MIRGPWATATDPARLRRLPFLPNGHSPRLWLSNQYNMPIDDNVITPKFRGERVALRVSNDDHDELKRGMPIPFAPKDSRP